MSEQTTAHGPYETSAQARADAAELIAAERAVDPGYGPMTDAVRTARRQVRVDYLTRTLAGAGVELGEYDRRIAAWLADWETETLQVLVGWIKRANVDQAQGGAAARVDLAEAAQDLDDPSLRDPAADLAGLPWRVYGLPRSGDQGRPWLVNAFATRQRAESFAGQHPEYGPLTITCADETDAQAEASAQPETTHHAVMRHGIGGPECGTRRVWEPMTRAWKAVTCSACLAALDKDGGA